MKALITPARGRRFHLWWTGRVVADAHSSIARRAVALLNSELDLPTSRANPGGTDSHSIERGQLLTRDDFLLTVGSLVDRLPGVLTVDLVGESYAIHKDRLDNPDADKAPSEQAIDRAMRRGLTRG
jgi:hypothetical protein